VRWESPVQTFFRTATTDVGVGDVVIPEGRKILMFLAAANRDPRKWVDPDSFDLSRDPSGHVGFGMGIHQCVGQHVARLEAEALLTALPASTAVHRAPSRTHSPGTASLTVSSRSARHRCARRRAARTHRSASQPTARCRPPSGGTPSPSPVARPGGGAAP
jgi:cytochrome P450